jgi:hypothetical protein
LGFIPEPEGFLSVVLLITALLFFVPGGLLLYNAYRNKDLSTMAVIRTLSLVSLITTLIFLVLNFLSVEAGEAAGNLLYGFLIIFSTPMVCSQNWLISLFLWACLLMASISLGKQSKK